MIEELGAIARFHTGQTGIGAGVPGGGGIRLKYSNPLYIDDVAVDFPGLKIILAHPSFPWQDEALSIATHKPSVYIDLSGWSPKYFPPQLVQYANTLLQDKVLFGSDFPLLTPDRWLADFAKLPIKDEVRPKILKQNAARLLGLLPAAGPRRVCLEGNLGEIARRLAVSLATAALSETLAYVISTGRATGVGVEQWQKGIRDVEQFDELRDAEHVVAVQQPDEFLPTLVGNEIEILLGHRAVPRAAAASKPGAAPSSRINAACAPRTVEVKTLTHS